MIEVLTPGFYTTIQDLGRKGYREFGVPASGAMDQYASKLANALLGNDRNAAVMEITLTGPKLKFHCNTIICVTGAKMNPILNEKVVRLNYPVQVGQGEELSFGRLELGYRSYLAVSGGFLTEEVLSSRSMYKPVTSEYQIRKMDVLHVASTDQTGFKPSSKVKVSLNNLKDHMIQVFKGPEYNLLTEVQKKNLQSREFTISKNNNRMGYQLNETLDNNLKSMMTGPVIPGTVQLTPSGKLIVLMRDGQTTGGYPRILQLSEKSTDVLAQKKMGDCIKFQILPDQK